MKNLGDTAELIEKTISLLMGNEGPCTAQAGIEMIDQWIDPLSESESTQPIAGHLEELKALLGSDPADGTAIIKKMGRIAQEVLMIAPDIGSEGEMPSLLTALAAGLRMGTENGENDQVQDPVASQH